MRIVFAKEECSRCDGSGRHSFNGRHSICYKCDGSKEQLTSAGKRALDAYRALIEERCTEKVQDIKPGTIVFMERDKFLFRKSQWIEVTESYTDRDTHWTLRFPDTENGSRTTSFFRDSPIRVHRPEVTDEIMQEVARRFKGATLIED